MSVSPASFSIRKSHIGLQRANTCSPSPMAWKARRVSPSKCTARAWGHSARLALDPDGGDAGTAEQRQGHRTDGATADDDHFVVPGHLNSLLASRVLDVSYRFAVL